MKRKVHEKATEFDFEGLKANQPTTTQANPTIPPTTEKEEILNTETGVNSEPKKKRIRHKKEVAGETVETKHDASLTKDGNHPSLSTNQIEREKLRRRSRREKAKEKKMDCFLCRQKGHSVANCPRNQQADVDLSGLGSICYRCGSLEHILAKCTQKSDSSSTQ